MHWINNVLFAAAVAAAAVGGGSAMAGEENKNMNELPTPYVTGCALSGCQQTDGYGQHDLPCGISPGKLR